jgi:uncharacterized membrane protein YozB (DUF420 family)
VTTEQWGVLLIYVATPAANLFPLLYILTADWKSTWAGRAVTVSKVGLAALVDAALLYQIKGGNYRFHDQVILVAFGLITLGTYLYLFAFAREQYRKRNGRGIA